jgi:hypothetical protein
METIEEDFSDSEAEAESVCAECAKPFVYCIGCLNENIEEYGIKKIGTEFIVARGHRSHCEEILKLIDPKIEPAKPMGLWYKFFSYLKVV